MKPWPEEKQRASLVSMALNFPRFLSWAIRLSSVSRVRH
jgi:hypothetical protein